MKFVLADDHAIVRQGIKTLLSRDSMLSCVAEVDDIDLVMDAVEQQAPDLLILDYKMPGGDAFATALKLKEEKPNLKIIFFTGIHSLELLSKLSQAGFDVLLLKADAPEELLRAIREINKGKKFVSPLVKNEIQKTEIGLTGRELQVLNLILMGWPRKEIADHLDISAETVKTYRKNLMRKLDAHTATEMIIKARELSLV